MSIQCVLVVDGDTRCRELLATALRALGRRVLEAGTPDEGLEALRRDAVDLAFAAPRAGGGRLLEGLRDGFPELPIVLVLPQDAGEAAVEAMRRGAADVLPRPFTVASVEIVLARVDRASRLRVENEYLRQEAGGFTRRAFIAGHRSMRELLSSATRAARAPGPVLVRGEFGTGKARLARLLHQRSPRAGEAFVAVCCVGEAPGKLEVELFGQERAGAAGSARRGRVELADRGTLLLEEIGEASMGVQARLVRLLQEQEFERVGGRHAVPVDLRLVATTSRELAGDVAAGRFREDLYYRLHVLPLEVPPLRERREDIVSIAEQLVTKFARHAAIEAPRLSEGAQKKLLAWSWPGNLRELENVMQRAVLAAGDGVIHPDTVSFAPVAAGAAPPPAEPQSIADRGACLTIDDPAFATAIANHAMSDIERIAILATLAATRGNKTEAARRLGLTARTLSNKMKIWRQAGLVS